MKQKLYNIANAIRVGWWAYKNPRAMQVNNFEMLSTLLEQVLKTAKEKRHTMSNIAMVHPDGENEEIVSIWAGAGIAATPTKRIAELLEENRDLKRELFIANNK